ncbi:MAG: hypothetical protein H8E37_04320 [Planctomycetes bacterium]|nr:hypothetical protein [Planctomycetota bacterium]
MINVGVIGVGPEWEKYRPALKSLRRPVGVKAVYDSVHARAEQVAAALSTDAVTGLGQLASRHDIRAVLLLESGWATTPGIEILARSGKPVFIRPWLAAPASFFEDTFERASQAGLMLMPAMWRRFMPSTMRLQELFATELGLPQRVTIQQKLPDSAREVSEKLVGWLDFARNLFRAYPQSARLDVEENSLRLTVEYPGRAEGSDPRLAVLTMTAEDCEAVQLRARLEHAIQGRPENANGSPLGNGHDKADEKTEIAQVVCECQVGRATLHSRTRLTWHLDESPDTTFTDEELRAERDEQQVMLDLFCRRLVGGLIPVADFSDISRALRLVESVL